MNNKGFTFIEVLISLSILIVIVSTTLPLFSQINKIALKSKSQYKLGKLAESYMEEIKASGNILIDNYKYSLEDIIEKETDILSNYYEIKIVINKTNSQSIKQINFHIKDNQTKESYELSSYIYLTPYKSDYEVVLKE
ncbi:type IV pilus modification PilV family protein [Anaerophilus nitritogenes]|uniref:type IV pilus modification PilV family protein n=1 Tax=Anaerophilus nitritogenes TaxID=2498136 RepID=UPI00101CD367|nr:type II secretion system protein [Anaerophilus nitritogenes]